MTLARRWFLPLLLLAPHAGQAQAINPNVLRQAIDRYAPILVLHQEERYKPTNVEEYLANTEKVKYFDDPRKPGDVKEGLRIRKKDPRLPDGYEPQPANYDPKVVGGDPRNAKAYVNVKVDAAKGTTDLQYWFFYAYNGPGIATTKELVKSPWKKNFGRYEETSRREVGLLGVHEADWEHIMVRIHNRDGLALPAGLYMAAHGDGHWYAIATLMEPVGGRPRLRVYASRNGHATFNNQDTNPHVTVKLGVVEYRLINDTERPGERVDFLGRCQIFGVHGDDALAKALNFTPPAWESITGRWGRVVHKRLPVPNLPGFHAFFGWLAKQAGAYDELTFEAGPYPPWSKDSWTGPE